MNQKKIHHANQPLALYPQAGHTICYKAFRFAPCVDISPHVLLITRSGKKRWPENPFGRRWHEAMGLGFSMLFWHSFG